MNTFDRFGYWPFWLLIAYMFVYQMSYPIVMGDTDMWYHLSGGRQTWLTDAVHHSTYFSFISPEREWVNYFWGFQALIYKIYDISGYYGLIVLRAILNVSIVLLIYQYIRKAQQKDRFNSSLLFLVLFALFFILVEGRGFQVRPHLFSYLFILSFLWILEYRPRYVWVLPLIIVPWVNIHGVEYVIAGLICGSYGLQWLIDRYQEKADIQPVSYAVWLVLCFPALFITPYGIDILTAPFALPINLDLFIGELTSLKRGNFIHYSLYGLSISHATAHSFLFLLVGIAGWSAIKTKDIKVHYLVMALAGLFLLTRGVRFVWEWALLSLPFLTYYLGKIKQNKLFDQFPGTVLAIVIFIIPFGSSYERISKYNDYPISHKGLQSGITSFFKFVASDGNIMLNPSLAGFYEWKLYPDYKVFMDMEFPPFTAKDFFWVKSFYDSPDGFDNFTDKYELDFFVVSISKTGLIDRLKENSLWEPVFFAGEHIVYANLATKEDIVKQYKITELDFLNLGAETDNPELKEKELLRLHSIVPKDEVVLAAIYRYYFDKKDYIAAKRYAQIMIDYYPASVVSNYMYGNVLQNLNQHGEAIKYYRIALNSTSDSLTLFIYTQLGGSYFLQEDYDNAHISLKKGMNPYVYQERSSDLYQLAISSIVLGKFDEAKEMAGLILVQEPKDSELAKNATSVLYDIESGKFDAKLSFIEFLLSYFSYSEKVEATK